MMGEDRSLRRIRLNIGYDGTDFCGWQIQDHQRTVQQEIERALLRMHGHHVRVHGSGRTDSGVHASGQTAHFDTDIASIPADRFTPALNSSLPGDVRILNSALADPDFHARFSALERQYRYVIKPFHRMRPVDFRFSLGVAKLPALEVLNGYASCLVGIHDFTSFTAAGDVSESKIRRIDCSHWHMEPDGALVYVIRGNAFLWKMVRSIVGTMLSLERAGSPAGEMREVLESSDRTRAGATAAAAGLTLERIWYE